MDTVKKNLKMRDSLMNKRRIRSGVNGGVIEGLNQGTDEGIEEVIMVVAVFCL